MEAFDDIWIDNLNGDKFATGKLTPAGEPDPSIFSTEWNKEGIQVGTAIALLLRKENHQAIDSIKHRDLWGTAKLQQLVESKDSDLAPVQGYGLRQQEEDERKGREIKILSER